MTQDKTLSRAGRRPTQGQPPKPLAVPEAAAAMPSSPEQAPALLAERMDSAALDLRTTGAHIETVSLLFDPDWYLWKYRDVEAAGVDPVQHYFTDGHKEGRNPNRYFDTDWYTAQNPDVLAVGSNPFLHYVLYGAREGRKPRP